MRRAFGGQSFRRTYYCGSATGKHIVSALVMELRRYEASGLVERKLWSCFYSALIKDGKCYGVILFDESIQDKVFQSFHEYQKIVIQIKR